MHTHDPHGLEIEPLLADIQTVHQLTSVSVRHLRRLIAADQIPGVVRVGRKVLFRVAEIRSWVAAGCPHQR